MQQRKCFHRGYIVYCSHGLFICLIAIPGHGRQHRTSLQQLHKLIDTGMHSEYVGHKNVKSNGW